MTDPAYRRPAKCRPLPPSAVDGRPARLPDGAEEAELLRRLDAALRELPDAERTAVIASYAYGEGVVGAAVELDVETIDAAELGVRGLALLRNALRDDVDGRDEPAARSGLPGTSSRLDR